MDKIADEHAGIWSVSTDDISDLENSIKILSQEEELYDDLNAKIK